MLQLEGEAALHEVPARISAMPPAGSQPSITANKVIKQQGEARRRC